MMNETLENVEEYEIQTRTGFHIVEIEDFRGKLRCVRSELGKHRSENSWTPGYFRRDGDAGVAEIQETLGGDEMRVKGYYEYYNTPLRMEYTDSGGLRAYRLNQWTGEFETANCKIERTLFAVREEVWRASYDDYVTLAEELRAHHLRGDAAVFAIYEVIDAIHVRIREKYEAQGASGIDEELTLIMSLRRQTFRLWANEFARRAAGEPLSFIYTSVAGELDDLRHVDPTPDIDPETVARWDRQLGSIRAAYDAALLESESRVAHEEK